MASPIDPPRTPLAPVARVLAEAALQRQNMLIGGDAASPPAAAPGAAPLLPGVPPGTPPQELAAAARPPLPVPAPADRVSLSSQARESLRGRDVPASRPGTGSGAGQGGGGAPLPLPSSPAAPAARSQAVPLAALAPAAWPATGVSAPLREVIGALVRQLTAPAQAQQVVAAQPWPAAMERALAEARPSPLPAMQTWLVGQGTVQTAEGARGVALTLRVPAQWLQGTPPQAPGAPAAPPALSAALAGRAQGLAPGVFALVLQPLEPGGARTSALLSLEVAPSAGAAAATVYGRDLLVRNDPWLHMAALQASGQWRDAAEEAEAARRGGREPCHATGCPYAGRAPCEQPFCMALRVMPGQHAAPS